MKKIYLSLATLFLFLFVNIANAEIWRLNNNATGTYGENLGGNVSKPVFASMAAVMSSSLIPASSGDTIYMEGSTVSYGDITISKQLTVIGTGYFLDQNDSTSWNNLRPLINNISISSSFIKLIGLGFNSIVVPTHNLVFNNLSIFRCNFNLILYSVGGGGVATFNNLEILSSWIYGSDLFSLGSGEAISLNNNARIQNNIILGRLNNYSYNIVNNNVFNSTQSLAFTCNEFKNNIIRQAAQTTAITCALSAFTHNIAPTAAQFPVGYNTSNLVLTESQQINTVFVNTATNTDDGDYQLRPAYRVGTATTSNLGADGTERGVYGGAYPYSKSGIGPIPVIYNVNTSGVANQTGLNISISTKAVK
jgi:hypothetical protein